MRLRVKNEGDDNESEDGDGDDYDEVGGNCHCTKSQFLRKKRAPFHRAGWCHPKGSPMETTITTLAVPPRFAQFPFFDLSVDKFDRWPSSRAPPSHRATCRLHTQPKSSR